MILGSVFSNPRAEPGHVLPAAAGTIVLLLMLPVFLLLGWNIRSKGGGGA